MPPKYIIGVDISKLTLDIAILIPNGQVRTFKTLNTEEGIIQILAQLKTEYRFRTKDVAILAENMMVDARFLLDVATKKKIPIYMVSALHIKRSLGIQRGKNDKLDAIRIAQFAKKNIQELKPWQPPRECIQQLKLLFSIRKRLSKIKSMLIHGEKSRSTYQTSFETSAMNSFYVSTLIAVRNDIQTLEEEMVAVVERDERLSSMLTRLKTIPFVGTIVGIQLIIYTNEFIDFDSAKKFASYCGVAPFDYSSGTSVRGKNRISHFANKDVKSMLHFAVIGYTSKTKYFLSRYYQRKVLEGKNKMSVLNAMRNKLIYRIFSCIKNGIDFVDI